MSTYKEGPTGGRRGSVSSNSGSPFRQRRNSLSIASPPSPSLPLSAAASINASMRGGSPGPASTARDSAASRRSSVVADLVLSDDKLPPPAEIAVSDRKGNLADNTKRSSDSVGNLQSGSPVDPFKSGGLRDPLSGSITDGTNRAHHRTPSISQVHQEMEQEQEAQVNRLLITIHQQQQQIESLQRQLEGNPIATSNTTVTPSLSLQDQVQTDRNQFSYGSADPTTQGQEFPPPPTPQRAHSSSSAGTTVASTMPASKHSPTIPPVVASNKTVIVSASHPKQSPSSRGSSRAASPNPRLPNTTSSMGNDDIKYWRSELESFSKENEMLKRRIKELENLLKDGKEDSNMTTEV